MESIPQRDKLNLKHESDFIEFQSYKKLTSGVIVAVMFNKWKEKEFFVTKENIEGRLNTLSSQGEKPDVSEVVLQNWPVDLIDDGTQQQ